ncbi:MAG: ketoacyl-ACP synthase III, partial [Oscillospiraceae bacterium]
MSGIEIIGTGKYVPEFVATNDTFAEFLDTSDEWIYPRTGIKERHISTDKPNYFMGTQAAKDAISDAGISPEDIDLI